MSGMPVVAPSTQEQIVRAAERLFARHGIEGVSLRQIGAAAGNGNNSAVQYHFGSKDQLIQAIFEDRLPRLHERRKLLIAERRPNDLRSWVECQPAGGHGAERAARQPLRQLRRHAPASTDATTCSSACRRRSGTRPGPSTSGSARFSPTSPSRCAPTASPGRWRSSWTPPPTGNGPGPAASNVLPFAVDVADLLDGMVGFLEAPVSASARAALDDTDAASLTWPMFP